MASRAALDALVTRALLDQGAVTPPAIDHARAVQARGFEGNPIGELLVDLELLSSEALVTCLAELSGAPLWDGVIEDPELSRTLASSAGLALAVRREAGTLVYATTEPHDEELRESVRFAGNAVRARPLVASEEQLGRAWRTLRELPVELSELELCESSAGDADAGDAPLVRLTNLLLLNHPFVMPGGALRVEASDRPRVLAGAHGFDDVETLWTPRSTLLARMVLRRLAQMAALPPGTGSRAGFIHVIAQRGRARTFLLQIKPTDRGDVAIVLRWQPWLGTGMRALEEIAASIDGALELEAQRRDGEARALIARAESLAREHELGGRVIAELATLAARVEMDDLERRIALFERAVTLESAPGPARRCVTLQLLEIAVAERFRDRHAAALHAAERTIAEDLRWFGATTGGGRQGMIEAALALAALERPDDARRFAERARALDHEDESVHWALGRAALAARSLDVAVTELSRALAFFTNENRELPSWPAIALDLAHAQHALGQLAAAQSTALFARALPLTAATAAAQRELEALLRRFAAYR